MFLVVLLIFRLSGSVCDRVERYIFAFNNTYENPFKLDRSVNPVDVETDNLSQMMNIPSLIESAMSHKKHLEDAYTDFQANIQRTIKQKVWPKIFIGFFILILIITICTIAFASRACLKRVYNAIHCQKKIDCLFHLCLKQEKCQVDDSPFNMNVHGSSSTQSDTCYDVMHQNIKNVDQFQPLLNKVDCNDLVQYSSHPNNSIKEISTFNSKVDFDYLPLTTGIVAPIDSSNILSSEIICKKPSPATRKIFDYMPELSDSPSKHSSITSGEFFEDLESEI